MAVSLLLGLGVSRCFSPASSQPPIPPGPEALILSSAPFLWLDLPWAPRSLGSDPVLSPCLPPDPLCSVSARP